MLTKLIAGSMTVALAVALAIMQLTTPATIHPIGLLVFFVCLYVFVLGLMTFLLRDAARLLRKARGRQAQSMSLWRAYQFASVIALGPVMLIAMRTVGTITALDIVFVGLFVAVAVFYIAKRG